MLGSRSSVPIREMLTALAKQLVIRVIQKLLPFFCCGNKEDTESDCCINRVYKMHSCLIESMNERETQSEKHDPSCMPAKDKFSH